MSNNHEKITNPSPNFNSNQIQGNKFEFFLPFLFDFTRTIEFHLFEVQYQYLHQKW